MKPLTEHHRNCKRFARLSIKKKQVINEMAITEFKKPLTERRKPVELLDAIEFNLKPKSIMHHDKIVNQHDNK